jgi:hypothetical protein
VTDLLAVYLRNHLAAARGGLDLFRRVADGAAGTPAGPELAALASEVDADLESLLRIARELNIAENKPFGLAARVGERVGRIKPNGALVRRSPLTDLIEIEGLLVAVAAKLAGWNSMLRATDTRLADARARLEDLRARALDQRSRLDQLHDDVAGRVLGTG